MHLDLFVKPSSSQCYHQATPEYEAPPRRWGWRRSPSSVQPTTTLLLDGGVGGGSPPRCTGVVKEQGRKAGDRSQADRRGSLDEAYTATRTPPVVGQRGSRRMAAPVRAHGPVMSLRLGLTTTVVVSTRDAAREAFTKHDRRIAMSTVPDIASGSSSSDPRWAALRSIVAAHIFSPHSLSAVRGVWKRKMQELVGYVRGRAGEEMDVSQALYDGVFNLVSSAFFSVDMVAG